MNYEFEVKRLSTGYEFTTVFHDITISNSNKASHYIGDIYVRFLCTNNGLIRDIQGARHTFTEAEIDASYTHSHISGACSTSFGTFCLGSGPLTRFNFADYHEPSEGEAMLFIILLKELVSWESLEGVPYKRISSIGGFSNPFKFEEQRLKSIIDLTTYDTIEFIISNGRVKVDRGWVQKQLKPNVVLYENVYYHTPKISNMRSQEQFETWRDQKVHNGGVFRFKRTYNRMTIHRNNPGFYEAALTLKPVTHPKIIDYYVQLTNDTLEDWLLQKIGAKGEVSNDNSQESLGSNNPPVFANLRY